MVYVWVGKRIPGSEIGKHLFKFDPFKLDSSYIWSLEAGPAKDRQGIVFGRMEQFIYVSSWMTYAAGNTDDRAVLSMLDVNGNYYFSLNMDQAHQFHSVLL